MHHHRQQQGGFVLVVSLIFLVIMTLLAITAIRKATLDEKVVGNLRTQELAFEAAERALRFCDTKIDLIAGSTTICQPKDPATKITPSSYDYLDTQASQSFPRGWQTDSNWTDATKTYTLSGDDAMVGVVQQPQCMIERWPLGPESKRFPYVITAKGSGAIASSVVILQEIVRCGNT